MKRFTDYHEAFAYAHERAKSTNLDVAIRKVKEYGQLGYNVGFASTSDSDYARAEIVRPFDPSASLTPNPGAEPLPAKR